MADLLKILILEDSVTDTEILLRMLRKENLEFQFRLSMDRETFLQELDDFDPTLILADNKLPQFNATEALEILNTRKLHIPFILVTGTVSEEFAANIIKAGADDYILKDRLARLPASIATAIKQRRTEQEKQDAIEELRENEKKYRSLVERVSDGFIALDLDWKFIYINTRAEELFDRPGGYLVGKNIWTEFPESVDSSFFKSFHKAHETQLNIYLKEYSVAIDKWLQTSIYPSPTGISVYFRDITEQRKAEEEFRHAHERLLFHVENAPLGFIEWDNQLFVRSWSKHAEEIFGWTEREFIEQQKNGISTVFEEDLPRMVDIVRQLTTGELERNTVQNRNITKAGKVIWCEWYNSVLKDKQGKVITILSLVQDITERKRADESIRATTNELRELSLHLQDIREEERTALSREVHDELGQQLTGLKMDIHWLLKKMEPGDLDIKEKMEGVSRAIDTTIRVVRKIATDLRPSILDDLGLIAALEWHSEEFERRSGIKVEFSTNSQEIDLEPKVAIALFRIYQELLTNVARHAEADIVVASITVTSDQLCMDVTDNGKGFSVETIANKKTLGLLGMKERTLLLAGKYDIKSEPGKGTTTLIRVPLIHSIFNQ